MTAADKFQNAVEALADDTAARAARILRSHRSKADKVHRLAALLQRSNANAVAVADQYVSARIEELVNTATPTRGVLPTDMSERLLLAAQTAMEDRQTAAERVERLARSEPAQTAQTSVTEALTGRPAGRGGYWGWIRQLDTHPCERCKRWFRNGRVWPPDHYMPRHPNCLCVPRVVRVDTKPKPVRKRRR